MRKNPMSLDRKRIVIIGGSEGLGLATAKAAALEDAEVILASRSLEKLQKAKDQIPGKVEIHVLDIMNEDGIIQFFQKIGEFDHLVTSGGFSKPGSIFELDSKDSKESFESKFRGQYLAAKYGSPQLRKGGSIVFFSGAFSKRPLNNCHILSAINGALESLAKALAIELAPIRVNVISPGFIDTGRLSNMPEEQRKTIGEIIEKLPLGRLGKPEEVAKGVLYLLTNDYVTGTILHVDGGYLLH